MALKKSYVSKALAAAATIAALSQAGLTPAHAQSPRRLRSTATENQPGLSVALSNNPPYKCVTNYYVNAATGNDANPGTLQLPWKTIQNADNGYPNVPQAGECVNVQPGTYSLTQTMVFGHGGNLAGPTGYLVYRSVVPQAAHIIAQQALANSGDLIQLWAPYIMIDGFEIDGNHTITSGHGIDGCAGGGSPTNIAHHIWAMNNIIHDMGGSGLSTCSADYIMWEHNEVYNTSATNQYQVSAINVWEPKALASSYTPTKQDTNRFGQFGIQLLYNIADNNSEGPKITGDHTDGNGIIIDTTVGSSQCFTCGTPYTGNILIAGNLSYRNGGGGIHIFMSENVLVVGNTVYDNYTDTANTGTARGDLSNAGSCGISWMNNIAYAVQGPGILANNGPIVTYSLNSGGFQDSGIWANNIAYGGPVTSDPQSNVNSPTDLIGVNPDLTDPAGGNFVPLSGSPAIGQGAASISLKRCAQSSGTTVTLPPALAGTPHSDIGAY